MMLGFIGSGCILLGMYVIGRKNKTGFLLGLLGETFWFARGVQTGLIDLLALSAIFAAMHIYNYYQWSAERG